MALLDILKKKKVSEKKTKGEEKSLKTSKEKVERALKTGKVRIDQAAAGGERLASVILRPRVTEKASFIAADGAYTFDVLPRANKIQIKRAIEEMYNVKPIRVNIVTIPGKRVFVRNRAGVKSGGKKAIVYLKEGDKIEFV